MWGHLCVCVCTLLSLCGVCTNTHACVCVHATAIVCVCVLMHGCVRVCVCAQLGSLNDKLQRQQEMDRDLLQQASAEVVLLRTQLDEYVRASLGHHCSRAYMCT
jgi:hypothetical protein